MNPTEFNTQIKAAVQAHAMLLGKFARARAMFRDMSSTTHPDWQKVGEALVVIGGIVDELIASQQGIDRLREEFTGVKKVNGVDPLPLVPPEGLQ